MDPYQSNQMHFRPHYYPGNEIVHPQMYMNMGRHPMAYEWPCGSNNGYVYPVPCHGCCNHSYYPTHCGWGHPYSHVPPIDFPRCYPYFPTPYMPPSHFPMGQPHNGYDKNMLGDYRFCEFPDHQCCQKGQKNAKIEKEESDGERRKNNAVVPSQFKNYYYPVVWIPPDCSNSDKEHGKSKSVNKDHFEESDGERINNDALAASQWNNYPYPIMWIPPDYYYSKERGKRNSDYKDSEDGSLEAKPHENKIFVQPTKENGCLPLDPKSMDLLKQRGNNERSHHHSGDGKGRIPFPRLWMPFKPEEKDGGEHEQKENDSSPNPRLEFSKGDSEVEKNKQTGGKATHIVKDIPVMKVAPGDDKDSSKKEASGKASLAKSKDDEEHLEGNSAKGKSTSPPKSSKLPPVCLRVDPFPRRKSPNGSSRSPSPPGNKMQKDPLSSESNKVLLSSDNEIRSKITKDIRIPDEVVGGKIPSAESKDTSTEINLPPQSREDISTTMAKEKPTKENISVECSEPVEAESKSQLEGTGLSRANNEGEVVADESKESNKSRLSEEEASVIIQSAYRGFDVRRWESLRKLKQIAEVREQIAEVKRLIQEIEVSFNKHNNKLRNIVAETIMSLLLKLDTIQGLHPSLREVRKSVVTELVSLQEKLDSLCNGKSEASIEQEPIEEHGDNPKKTADVISSQNESETQSDFVVSRQKTQNQLSCGSENNKSEVLETNLVGASNKFEMGAAELSEGCSTNGIQPASQPIPSNEDEQGSIVDGNDKTFVGTMMDDHDGTVRDRDPECTNSSSMEAADGDELESELLELPSADCYAEEFEHHGHLNAYVNNGDREKQQDEALVEPCTEEIQEHDEFHKLKIQGKQQKEACTDKGNEEHNEEHKFGDLEKQQGTTFIDACTDEGLQERNEEQLYKELDADNRIEDVGYMNDECSGPLAEQDVFNMSGPCRDTNQAQLSIAESCNGDEAACTDTSPDDNVMGDVNRSQESNEDEYRSPIKYPSSQSAYICNLEQETSLNDEPTETGEPADTIGVKELFEERVADGTNSDEHRQDVFPSINEIEKESEDPQGENGVKVSFVGDRQTVEPFEGEFNVNDQLQETDAGMNNKETHPETEAISETKDVFVSEVCQAPSQDSLLGDELMESNSKDVMIEAKRDKLMESNEKLIEENERLRNMMERLINSGQQQLAAISSLSGRVKNMEKKLSRKKKLKVKRCRSPIS